MYGIYNCKKLNFEKYREKRKAQETITQFCQLDERYTFKIIAK